ncbi:sensor histidine kinase [Chitinophaga vietnamensis]|uniref:sensor histidine kinase n=1 Tax=Chitinophaga vietnamensis TaxID=2593957 RepID=UPI0013755872|nr:sensor histidine kinase [Chitinophaga vietnamensis]
MIRLKSAVVLAHITGWLICLSLPLLLISGQVGDRRTMAILFSPDYLVFILTYASLFYFHTNFLFPQLYFRKQYVLYFLSVVILLLMIDLMQPFDHLFLQFSLRPQFKPMAAAVISGFPLDPVSIFLFLLTIALSVAIETTHRWRQTEKRALYAETKKTQAELSFLKAQINPHFLFNTLNNIYSLAMIRHEYTAPSIMKLSNMLRYVTEETRDFVLLQSEIDCLRDYVDLQKLRLSRKTTASFIIKGLPGARCIAPLVLLPFMENAFKYGVSNHEPSEINIALDIEDDHLHFRCSNKVFPLLRDKHRTGVGIANTRQRLEHLYPGRYELDIHTTDMYTISLKIWT